MLVLCIIYICMSHLEPLRNLYTVGSRPDQYTFTSLRLINLFNSISTCCDCLWILKFLSLCVFVLHIRGVFILGHYSSKELTINKDTTDKTHTRTSSCKLLLLPVLQINSMNKNRRLIWLIWYVPCYMKDMLMFPSVVWCSFRCLSFGPGQLADMGGSSAD